MQPLRTQKVPQWNANIIIESKIGEDLMKKKNLLGVKKLMEDLQQLEVWDDVCLAKQGTSTENHPSCSPDSIISPVQTIEAEMTPLANGVNFDLNDAAQSDINVSFRKFLDDPDKWEEIQAFFGGQEEIFWSYGQVKYMRIFIRFGAPIEFNGIRYNDATDRE